MKHLDEILVDPLKVFDYVSREILRNTHGEKVIKVHKDIRAKIVAAPHKGMQYAYVAAYLLLLSEYAYGDTLSFFDEAMEELKEK